MSTSNSQDFNLTRDQIIRQAYEYLGLYSPSDTLENEDIYSASVALNMMIKSWHSDGVYIWKETEGIIFLDYNTRLYQIGGGDIAPARACDIGTFAQTTTTADLNSSATSITVSTTADMAAGNYIGIELDGNSLFWTTIVSIDSSTSLTITSGLTSTATSGNIVYSYLTTMTKPLIITSARVRDSNKRDRNIDIYAREDYLNLPNKYDLGQVYIVHYQPRATWTDIFTFAVPQSVKYTLHINYFKVFDDFDNATDNADFPVEWLECLVFNLAKRMAMKMGKDTKMQADIGPIADDLYQRLREWSHDHTYVQMAPYQK